jgi:hypothetical protein
MTVLVSFVDCTAWMQNAGLTRPTGLSLPRRRSVLAGRAPRRGSSRSGMKHRRGPLSGARCERTASRPIQWWMWGILPPIARCTPDAEGPFCDTEGRPNPLNRVVPLGGPTGQGEV